MTSQDPSNARPSKRQRRGKMRDDDDDDREQEPLALRRSNRLKMIVLLDILPALATELQIMVLEHLGVRDFWAVYNVSRAWRAMLSEHVVPLLSRKHFPGLLERVGLQCRPDATPQELATAARQAFLETSRARASWRNGFRYATIQAPGLHPKRSLPLARRSAAVKDGRVKRFFADPGFGADFRLWRIEFAHGRVAWQGSARRCVFEPTVRSAPIFVDDLHTGTRRAFFLPTYYGSEYSLEGLGDTLVVARAGKYIVAWKIQDPDHARAFVCHDYSMAMRSSGEHVMALFRSGLVAWWKFGSPFHPHELDISSVVPTNSGEMQLIIHPHRDVFYTCRLDVVLQFPVLIIDEFTTGGEHTGAWTCQLDRYVRRHHVLHVRWIDSHGTFRISQSDNIYYLTGADHLVSFNIFTKQFSACSNVETQWANTIIVHRPDWRIGLAAPLLVGTELKETGIAGECPPPSDIPCRSFLRHGGTAPVAGARKGGRKNGKSKHAEAAAKKESSASDTAAGGGPGTSSFETVLLSGTSFTPRERTPRISLDYGLWIEAFRYGGHHDQVFADDDFLVNSTEAGYAAFSFKSFSAGRRPPIE